MDLDMSTREHNVIKTSSMTSQTQPTNAALPQELWANIKKHLYQDRSTQQLAFLWTNVRLISKSFKDEVEDFFVKQILPYTELHVDPLAQVMYCSGHRTTYSRELEQMLLHQGAGCPTRALLFDSYKFHSFEGAPDIVVLSRMEENDDGDDYDRLADENELKRQYLKENLLDGWQGHSCNDVAKEKHDILTTAIKALTHVESGNESANLPSSSENLFPWMVVRLGGSIHDCDIPPTEVCVKAGMVSMNWKALFSSFWWAKRALYDTFGKYPDYDRYHKRTERSRIYQSILGKNTEALPKLNQKAAAKEMEDWCRHIKIAASSRVEVARWAADSWLDLNDQGEAVTDCLVDPKSVVRAVLQKQALKKRYSYMFSDEYNQSVTLDFDRDGSKSPDSASGSIGHTRLEAFYDPTCRRISVRNVGENPAVIWSSIGHLKTLEKSMMSTSSRSWTELHVRIGDLELELECHSRHNKDTWGILRQQPVIESS